MIRVLCADDSALMRRLLAEIFAAAGDFEVCFARDGAETLALLKEQRPDVVTLDIQMPRMDGLACLDRIMVEQPTPVVMFSSLTADGAAETLDALAMGAVDFVLKPGGAVSLKIDSFGPELVAKVRAAATARPAGARRLSERVRLRTAAISPLIADTVLAGRRAASVGAREFDRLVLVGCSTGGPPALDALLAPLPADFPWPIVIAQHMPASFTGALARRLDGLCALQVSEVVRPFRLQPGQVHVARGDADILISRRAGGVFALPVPANAEHRWHPSVNRMVDSARSAVDAGALVGVLMTGMGDDGAAAFARARAEGARTIAEAQESAVVWGMPGELVRVGGAEFVEPLEAIATRLLKLASL